MNNLQKKPLAVALALTLAGTVAQAQQQETSRGFDLDPIVVTSTLGSETVDDSLSSVTVIDSETMDRQQRRELSQVLRGQPGINVSSAGSFGKDTSVFTRGTGSESTILLLDGIRIRSATTGGAPWQFIPPQLINRMEIVRGPRGSLYGADAVGGVVQGFTMPSHERDTHWVEAGGGSFSTHQVGAGAAGMEGNTRYSLQGNYFDTEGTRVREDGDDKGFRNAAGTASVRHELNNGGSIGVLGLHSRGRTEFDGGKTDYTVQTLGVNAETPVAGPWSTKVQLSESRDEQDQVLNDSFFDTRTRTARWENALKFESYQFIAGVEYSLDDVDTLSEYTEDSRENKAIFSQLLTGKGPFGLQLSARWDDNEAFGEEFTGAAAIGWDFIANHDLRLSYGTAFIAPTFNDLYSPFFPDMWNDDVDGYEGNPDVDPEKSGTAELGIRGYWKTAFWDVAVFQTDVKDLIQGQLGDDRVQRPENVDRARIRGVELAGGLELTDWDIRASATFQDPRDRDTDNRLRRRTIQSARIDADYSHGPVSWGVSGVVEGDRYDDVENNDHISGFATADLRVGAQITDMLSARFTMENMFNRQYETRQDFITAGRTVFASIRYGAK